MTEIAKEVVIAEEVVEELLDIESQIDNIQDRAKNIEDAELRNAFTNLYGALSSIIDHLGSKWEL